MLTSRYVHSLDTLLGMASREPSAIPLPHLELNFILSQIKHHGMRIEAAEIEHIIMSHTGAERVIVQPISKGNDRDELAAYVAPSSAAGPKHCLCTFSSNLPVACNAFQIQRTYNDTVTNCSQAAWCLL